MCAVIALVGALFTVCAANPIRGAMGLLLTIAGMAALFLSLHAEFLAMVQLIVYAGAVVVLFVFAIMLLGAAAMPPHDHETLPSRLAGLGGIAVVSVAGIVSIWVSYSKTPTPFPTIRGGEGSIESMAREVFGPGLVPFEIASALLLVAVVGAVAVARGRQGEPAAPVRTTLSLGEGRDDFQRGDGTSAMPAPGAGRPAPVSTEAS